MGINKNLNVDPYYDDFDEEKQFNRVLFKPAKAVQARELTQLQTILQKQVERFGSNIYREGTIISGVNLTARPDLFFVKLKDQPGFTNPALYNEIVGDDGSTSRFVLRGASSGLIAEIVKGLPGFETSAPDLKTFYIVYQNTSEEQGSDIKQFGQGELLELLNPDLTEVVGADGVPIAFTTMSGDGAQVGRAFGVSCEEGVIYQRGHFIFVDRQLVIVTRYSNIPGQDGLDAEDPDKINPISLGFDIEENIVNSDLDPSLLDNAQGFNNFQAPGADRLQLVPTLSAYNTDSEPTNFFALIRYVGGKTVRLRDYSEFSLLGEELAKRTYDESGHYVIEGLRSKLDRDTENQVANVTVSPGKAYVFGKEVRNLATKTLPIEPVTTTQTKEKELTQVSYDQHYQFNIEKTEGIGSNEYIDGIDFTLDGGADATLMNYKLIHTDGSTVIGTCNVSNVDNGKIYVFNIKKKREYEDVAPGFIALEGWNGTGSKLRLKRKPGASNAPIGLVNPTEGCMIFDTGKTSIESIDTITVNRRIRLDGAPLGQGNDAASTITIATDASGIPIATNDVIAITTGGKIVAASSVAQLPNSNLDPTGDSAGILCTFTGVSGTENFAHLYYSKTVFNVQPDSLTEKIGFVETTFSGLYKLARLGVANVVEVLNVYSDINTQEGGNQSLVNVTSRFKLVNNQKDSFYDLSYIKLKQGQQVPPTNTLFVEFRYLDRSYIGGMLTANSYENVTSKHLVSRYTSKNLGFYDLISSFDLRPYAKNEVGAISATLSGALPVTQTNIDYLGQVGELYPPNIVRMQGANGTISNKFVINSTHTYYLSRKDTAIIDEYGNMRLVKGGESENPVPPLLGREYKIADIKIPGNTTEISGANGITISRTLNKNYTMTDIRTLEKKVDNLTDLVTLSLAEVDAKNMIVTDEDGVERFKNGILTDTFKDYFAADVGDPQWSCTANRTRRVGTPQQIQFPIDLKVNTNSSDTFNISDVVGSAFKFDNLTTLQPIAVTHVLVQPFATNFRNCVSNYYSYQGITDIYPKFDYGYDVVQNPAINFELDIATSILDAVDNIQQFIPLQLEGEVEETFIGREINRAERLQTQTFIETQEITTLDSTVNESFEQLGNFITDISMTPYLRTQNIQILVGGLRPNTRHYFFFDKKDINAHVGSMNHTPKSFVLDSITNASQTRFFPRLDTKGQPVYSDANGRIMARFEIPASTFFVGERILEITDVSQYNSIESAGTSYSRAKYSGYSFTVAKSELNATTRTVDFDTSTDTIILREFQRSRRWDPIAQTFRLPSTSVDDAPYAYIDALSVYFKSKSITAGVTVQIRETKNGVPTKNVLPGASKTLRPGRINISSTGNIETVFQFDDPVKLKGDEEYCFVVIPEGNSPDYLVWTSKVGETSKSKANKNTQVSVTNDWGDGVLFTSTNDSAWKSYQDEDMKFRLRRFLFKTEGKADLVPNDIELLTLRNNKVLPTGAGNDNTTVVTTPEFRVGELAYVASYAESADASLLVTDEASDNKGLQLSAPTLDRRYGMSLAGPDDQPNKLIWNPGQTDNADTFLEGDMILIQDTVIPTKKTVAKIINVTTGDSGTKTYTIDGAYFSKPTGTVQTVDVRLCVAGIVSHYDPKNPSTLHIKQSSATAVNYLDNSSPINVFGNSVPGQIYTIESLGTLPNDVNQRIQNWVNLTGLTTEEIVLGKQYIAQNAGSGDGNGTARPNNRVITGLESGAEATISSVDEETISYFQPQIPIDNTINTESSLELKSFTIGAQQTQARPVSLSSNNYLINDVRKLVSKSKRLREGTSENFVISTSLSSNNNSVSPMLDIDLAELNVVQYKLTDDPDTSSNWITKEVILDKALPAVGLRAILNAYRPPGTNIDAYARFTYVDDPDTVTDWVKLIHEPQNERSFSAPDNINDFKEYTWNLPESPTDPAPYLGSEYATFQVRLTLRHMTDEETNNVPDFGLLNRDLNTFVHFNNLRVIAVT